MDISVAVCTYNRAETLRRALGSLLDQDTAGAFSYEIVVIDDGSTDHTGDVVREAARSGTAIPVTYVHKEGGGIAAARNEAVERARGKWIAFFDDDQWAEPRWLAGLHAVAQASGAHCVGGAMLLDLPKVCPTELTPFCRKLLDERTFGDKPVPYPSSALPSTGNVLVRTELFRQVGRFDTEIRQAGEDTDLFARAHRSGAAMWYAPGAVAHHVIPEFRLSSEYLEYVALRVGFCGAQIHYKYSGPSRWLFALGRSLLRSVLLDLWVLLAAGLTGNATRQIHRRCRLWRVLGYLWGGAALAAPGLFGRHVLLDNLNVRARRSQEHAGHRKGPHCTSITELGGQTMSRRQKTATPPRISIVTCSYNHGEFLEEAILSVLDQDYPNLEYLVVDGASTDGSADIIRKHAGRLAFWVSEPDAGQTHALIKGFANATGDIQGWLCSDDLLEAGALTEVAQFFMANPQARVVYGDVSFIDRGGEVLRVKRRLPFVRWIWLHERNYIPQPSTFWRRELYEEVGGLDASFNVAMDKDLWQRFSEQTAIHHVARLWSRMRTYPEAKSWGQNLQVYEEELRIRDRALGKPMGETNQAFLRCLAGSVRVVGEQALSTFHSFCRQGEPGRPCDSPVLGFRQAYQRRIAYRRSYRKAMQQHAARRGVGGPL